MSIMRRFDDETYDAAIDEMQGMKRYVDDFLIDGAEVTNLVCLFMGRGLPINDRTSRDDRLRDAYETQKELLRPAFEKFCHEKPMGHRSTRVDAYIDYIQRRHEEDAA